MEMDMVDENAPLRKKRAKKIFICQICSKSFKDNYKLKRHKKVHIRSGEIPEPNEIITSEVDKLEVVKEWVAKSRFMFFQFLHILPISDKII